MTFYYGFLTATGVCFFCVKTCFFTAGFAGTGLGLTCVCFLAAGFRDYGFTCCNFIFFWTPFGCNFTAVFITGLVFTGFIKGFDFCFWTRFGLTAIFAKETFLTSTGFFTYFEGFATLTDLDFNTGFNGALAFGVKTFLTTADVFGALTDGFFGAGFAFF